MSVIQPMAPAFATRRSALAFCFIVAVLLVLPAVLRSFHVPGHEDRLTTVPISAGSYSFLQQQIFRETSDLDLVFLGDSLMLMGVDTPFVERELGRSLGSHANVLTLGWLGRGDDLMFYVLRDLLAHRRVKFVVLRLPAEVGTGLGGGPHPLSYRWLTACEHDPVQPRLPLSDRVATYAIESVGALRNVLSLVRPNLLSTSPYTDSLGAQLWDVGPGRTKFSHYQPAVQVLSAAQIVSKLGSSDFVRPDHKARSPYARGYLSAIRALLESHHVPLALLHAPVVAEARQNTMTVDGIWAEVFPAATPVIAIAPSNLFAKLSDEQVRQLYFDGGHFNRNGAEYFTASVMPALSELVSNAEEAQ
jgi:hypothetical protein